MAPGERFKGGGAPSIAQFLAEHEACDAGFNVERSDQAGSGRVRISCEGCGKSTGYRMAEAGDMAAAGSVIPPGTAGKPYAAVKAADFEQARRTAERPAKGSSRRRIGVPLAVLGICGALLVVGAGVLGSDDDEPAPEPNPAPSAAVEPEPDPIEPAPQAQPKKLTLNGVELERRTFADVFSIGVPAGWEAVDQDDEKAEIEAPDSSAGVTVYFGPSDLSPIEFANTSELFLAQRHDGAVVGPLYPAKFKGKAVARARISYDGGEEIATFFSRGGVSYVLLKRVEGNASRRQVREAEATLDSFTPR
jgi:hypothetical protein